MQRIIDISRKAAADKFNTASGCCISMRTQVGMFVTGEGADLAQLNEIDIMDVSRGSNLPKEYATHMAIYQAMPQVNVIMHLKPYYCTQMSIHNISPYTYLQDYAEVIGKRFAMTTSVPHRLVETISKQGCCLCLNNGLFIVGKSVEGTYAKAVLAERAAFTYTILKLLEMDNDIINIPSKAIHEQRIKYLRNRDASPMPDSYSERQGKKLAEKLRKLVPDMPPMHVDILIFSGILASCKLKSDDNMAYVEYKDIKSSKEKLAYIKLLQDNEVVVVGGVGVCSINDNHDDHVTVVNNHELGAQAYIMQLIADKYGSDSCNNDELLIKHLLTKI